VESILCGALRGKVPLFAALFTNCSVDESFKAVFNSSSIEEVQFRPIHCFYPDLKSTHTSYCARHLDVPRSARKEVTVTYELLNCEQ